MVRWQFRNLLSEHLDIIQKFQNRLLLNLRTLFKDVKNQVTELKYLLLIVEDQKNFRKHLEKQENKAQNNLNLKVKSMELSQGLVIQVNVMLQKHHRHFQKVELQIIIKPLLLFQIVHHRLIIIMTQQLEYYLVQLLEILKELLFLFLNL